MNYQWYPGHMTKAKRMMQEHMKLIDLVIELLDARVPVSSRNPDLKELAANKARIVVLNKADLADEALNRQWASELEKQGALVMECNAKAGGAVKEIRRLVDKACKEKKEKDLKRGIVNRPVRAMVVGIPNVGKSTLINALAGKACTKTGNKPGVTKGKQWIRVHAGLELLDTPGILWPKFEDAVVGRNLAMIGSINDELLQKEELALELAQFLSKEYPDCLAQRYGLEAEDEAPMLNRIAQARKCYLKNEVYDTKKAAGILLDDFRNGRLGRISLEKPPAAKEK